jgi:3-hydroxybutyrate dehydrogenase
MSLRGRVAIVTGSTSGIGLGIAEALAAEGAAVMVNGFGNADEIEALRADLAARHGVEVRHDLLAEKQPMLAFSTPAQIGGLCVFLCSEAACTITGVPLSIDGGWTAT